MLLLVIIEFWPQSNLQRRPQPVIIRFNAGSKLHCCIRLYSAYHGSLSVEDTVKLQHMYWGLRLMCDGTQVQAPARSIPHWHIVSVGDGVPTWMRPIIWSSLEHSTLS